MQTRRPSPVEPPERPLARDALGPLEVEPDAVGRSGRERPGGKLALLGFGHGRASARGLVSLCFSEALRHDLEQLPGDRRVRSTSGRKSHDVIPKQRRSVSAVIVAVRSMSAISADLAEVVAGADSPQLAAADVTTPCRTRSRRSRRRPCLPRCTVSAGVERALLHRRCDRLQLAVVQIGKERNLLDQLEGASAMARSIKESGCEIRRVKLTVVGCSPAWPNPGGAQSGYLVERLRHVLLDCGPGVLARLRERDGWPERRRDRDHALPPRPLGRPRAVGVGHDLPRAAATRRRAAAALGPAGRDRAARAVRLAARLPRHVRARLRRCTSTRRTSRSRPPAHGRRRTRVPHYRLDAYAFRVTDGVRDARLLRRLGAERRARRAARDADLFVCEATLAPRRARRRAARAPRRSTRRWRRSSASGAKRLLVTHRPAELPSTGRPRARPRRPRAGHLPGAARPT